MKTEITVAPPNSIVLIAGNIGTAEIPQGLEEGLVSATATCIAVGTRYEQDGNTIIVLTDEPSERDSHERPLLAYRGSLALSHGRVGVFSVVLDEIIGMNSRSREPTVDVWVDDSSEPAWIC